MVTRLDLSEPSWKSCQFLELLAKSHYDFDRPWLFLSTWLSANKGRQQSITWDTLLYGVQHVCNMNPNADSWPMPPIVD